MSEYGTAAYWQDRYNTLYDEYMDMQRVLAAITDQNGGKLTVYGHVMAALPRLTWLHAQKTVNGGIQLALTKVPDGPAEPSGAAVP